MLLPFLQLLFHKLLVFLWFFGRHFVKHPPDPLCCFEQPSLIIGGSHFSRQTSRLFPWRRKLVPAQKGVEVFFPAKSPRACFHGYENCSCPKRAGTEINFEGVAYVKMATDRPKRANAGRNISKLLEQEEMKDEFYSTAYGGFQDISEDEEYQV